MSIGVSPGFSCGLDVLVLVGLRRDRCNALKGLSVLNADSNSVFCCGVITDDGVLAELGDGG